MFETMARPFTPKAAQMFRPFAGKQAPAKLCRLTVTVLPKISRDTPPHGLLRAGATSFVCALGAGAVNRHKLEGDGASPAGRFRLLGGWFKPTCPRPRAPWPMRPIRQADGWCDDPKAPTYNRPLQLPCRYSHEQLWRNDGLYDLVIMLDYNIWPRRKFRGSAIFLHCAREDYAPTGGCIALSPGDLRKLLPRLSKKAVLVVR